jgi:hypothetical protein
MSEKKVIVIERNTLIGIGAVLAILNIIGRSLR